MLQALIVEDDAVVRLTLAQAAEAEGFGVVSCESVAGARGALEKASFDIVLLDVKLPDGSGLDLLKSLQTRAATEVVLLTAHGSEQDSIEARQFGASTYLKKPVSESQLKAILANVARAHELKTEVENLRDELRNLGQFGDILGSSQVMQKLYDKITRVAPTDATVLIVGESGTGKEMVAKTIHEFSLRRTGPYLPINCGAIAPNLIESELFGHEKGSFTGANQRHHGVFERAHGGTLFLDEITEMPIELQTKLLRVLETGRIVRVGGDQEIEVDVRLLAATNRDPQKAVEDNELREDLLYRLSVFPIEVPPLRERGGDVELLAGYFLADLNKAQGTAKRFCETALEAFASYDWPGNVRELKNVIHRAFIMADEVITIDPEQIYSRKTNGVTSSRGESDGGPVIPIKVGTPLVEVEKMLILATLDACHGNKKATADRLGISLRTLYNRLKEY